MYTHTQILVQHVRFAYLHLWRKYPRCRKTVHVVFKYLFNSILHKWVGAGRVTPPLLTTTLQYTVSEFSGIGLSYRSASPCCLAGRYDNPMPELTLSPSHGSMNWGIVHTSWSVYISIKDDGTIILLGVSLQPTLYRQGLSPKAREGTKRTASVLPLCFIHLNYIVSIQHTIDELYCILC
jgi:hypothetical protein